jgi:dihydrofolate reductase
MPAFDTPQSHKEKRMRKIVTTTWITLDGYIAGPNEAMDWVIVDDEMGQYEDEVVSAADTLLLGRVTYESFSGSWPHVPDNPDASAGEREYARKLNAMRKVVFSTTLGGADWNNSTVVREVAPEDIEKLKQEPGRDMLIYGSATLIRTLTNQGLIDEYQLLVHPVILGAGKPLFADITSGQKLELVKTRPFASGVIGLYYRPAGA